MASRTVNFLNALWRRIVSCFAFERSARPDLISRRQLRYWRRRLVRCYVEPDLEVRGRPDALSCVDIGTEVAVDRNCIFWLAAEENAAPLISIADRVYIGPFCYLGSFAPITVGRDTIIGGYSYLITGNHATSRSGVPYRAQGYEGGPIWIGSNVWIGCHVVVLPGVTIGDGAIVGAGAVVTKDVPSGETWAGIPAKKIREK